jgi:hypothetical protein
MCQNRKILASVILPNLQGVIKSQFFKSPLLGDLGVILASYTINLITFAPDLIIRNA